MKTSLLLVSAFFCCSLLFACKQSQPEPLRVSSFNIRLDIASDSSNAWGFRKAGVARFLEEQQLQLLGMQEVLHHQLTDILAACPEYGYAGVGRDDGRTKGEYSPVLFRKDLFELLSSNTFWLSEQPDSAGSKGWGAAYPRVATWAKLKSKATGKILVICNTHLDHMSKQAQQNGLQLILDSLAVIGKGLPVILCGDFNVTTDSPAYLLPGASPLELNDSYVIANEKSGPAWTFHDFGREREAERVKIDYIFVSPGIHVDTFQSVFEEADGVYLSDHNPVIANILL